MSHFSLIVTGDSIEEQLQPYHEYECTGILDKYVQDVDKTEEARKEYLDGETTRYKSPDGVLHDPYLDHFYRVPTPAEIKKIGVVAGTGFGQGMSWTSKDWGDGRGYSTRVHFCPEGWEELQIPTHTVETFVEWASGYYGMKVWPHFGTEPDRTAEEFKYGFITLESTGELKRLVDRTNPNKRWDWWQVGGRYSNRLILHNGQRVNSARKSDINYNLMMAEKIGSATSRWNAAMDAFGDTGTHKTWEEMDHDREAYQAQPRVAAFLKNARGNDLISWEEPDSFLISRDQYLLNASNQAMGAFAFLHAGQWHEKGTMGMFACVRDGKTDTDWFGWLAEQIQNLPDDTLITVVDCHI